MNRFQISEEINNILDCIDGDDLYHTNQLFSLSSASRRPFSSWFRLFNYKNPYLKKFNFALSAKWFALDGVNQ